jgi:hypothetical protein
MTFRQMLTPCLFKWRESIPEHADPLNEGSIIPEHVDPLL